MTDLYQASPWLLLLGVPLAAALVFGARRGARSIPFGPGLLLEGGLPRTWRNFARFLPGCLTAAGLALSLLALARPVARVPARETREGLDILLCLDTSSSMAATDLDPRATRLDVAKAAAARFVAGRTDDRIGLVTFARYPDLRCPPTADHGALGEILAGVSLVENEGPEDATGIGTATARAVQVLAGGGAGAGVVILFSDGEENVAAPGSPSEIAPLHAGQLAETLGTRVYAIAAGEPEAGGSVRGTEVRDLARRTGGRYFEARDADSVAKVYAEIDSLTKAARAEPRYEVEDRFPPFLLGAVLLLLGGRLASFGPLAVRP